MAIPVKGNLADFDYLIFKITGEAGKKALLKLDGPNKENEVTFNGTEQTIVWDLRTYHPDSDAALNAMAKILIFAEPNTSPATGTFTVTNAYFSMKNPLSVNVYSGGKADFTINDFWADNGDKVYTITQAGITNTVAYNKVAGQGYSTMAIPVKGNLADFDYLIFKITGEAGKKALLKLDGPNKENEVTFNGTEQTIVWDLRTYHPASDAALNAMTKILIFAEPNTSPATGTFTVTNAYFSMKNPLSVNIYSGGKADFTINDFWTDNGDKVYTITQTGTTNTVAYNKGASQEYSTMAIPVKGNLADFNYLVFSARGTKDKQVMIKLEKNGLNIEYKFTFDGNNQTLVCDLSALHPANDGNLNALDKILIFAEPGTTPATGTFTVTNAYFSMKNPLSVNIYSGGKADFTINDFWTDNGDKVYTITQTGTTNTVAYNKGASQEYSTMAIPVKGNLADFNYLVFSARGTKDKQVMIKLEKNGLNIEYKFTFDGNDQTLVCDLSTLHPANDANLNALDKVLIFAEPGTTPAAGTFTVTNAFFTTNYYAGGSADFHFGGWFDKDGNGAFTVGVVSGVTVVNANNSGWSTLRAPLTGNFADFNAIKIRAKGDAGKQILLKIDNSGLVKELYCTFDGTEQVFTLDFSDKKPAFDSQLNSLKDMMIFYNPLGDSTGTFQIYDTWFTVTP
jgi:hypothetical protein